MPNFLEALRLRNIFNPMPIGNDLPSQGGITGNLPTGGFADIFKGKNPFETIDFGVGDVDFSQPTPSPVTQTPTVTSPADRIRQRMMELYTPKTEATDRFNELVRNYPKYEKPGFLRTIAAALTAFGPGGHNLGMQVANFHNERRLREWKDLIGPAQQAANLERQENVNERMLAYQTISQELRAEADAERARNNERNAQIRQQRADVYEFKAHNPNFRLDFSGPTVKVANPITGEVRDTGMETGALSDADKMILQQENELERIGARTRGQIEVEGVRQTGRERLAETRGWKIYNIPDGQGGQKAVKINEITGEVRDLEMGPANTPTGPVSRPSSSGGRSDESPTQTRVRQFNAARELANTRPDLAQFIKLGRPGSNDFEIVPPSTNFFGRPSGPTPEQYREMIEAIYGPGGIPINQPTRTGAPSPSNIPANRPSPAQIKAAVPPGRVAVQDKDGNIFTVPENQLQLAIAQGYTEVK